MTRKFLLGALAAAILYALALGASGCSSDCEEWFACLGDDGPPDHCSDDKKSGDETDVDCGGSCNFCADGLACESNDDCDSGNCTGSVCVSVCGDGIPRYQTNEQCDDGNTASGDGCDPACQVETGLICTANVCYLQGQTIPNKDPELADLADTSQGEIITSFKTKDGSGNLIWTGLFSDTVNFGGADLSSPESFAIFLAKYDASGKHLWSKSFGNGYYQKVYAAAADSAGNVLITGNFSDIIDFGGGLLTAAPDVGFYHNADAFVAKFDASGNHLWSRSFGGSEYDTGDSIAADSAGNVLVTGTFGDILDFGGSSISADDGDSFGDAFVLKFDAGGSHLWSTGFGGKNDQEGTAISSDSSNNAVVTGSFVSEIDFGGVSFSVNNGAWSNFLAKVDASGYVPWAKNFQPSVSSSPRDLFRLISTDSAGRVLVIGNLAGTLNCGGDDLTRAGFYDIFVVQYDAAGNHLWSTRFINAEYQTDFSVGTDGSGKLLVTGFVP